jgi:hypothetical protein
MRQNVRLQPAFLGQRCRVANDARHRPSYMTYLAIQHPILGVQAAHLAIAGSSASPEGGRASSATTRHYRLGITGRQQLAVQFMQA